MFNRKQVGVALSMLMGLTTIGCSSDTSVDNAQNLSVESKDVKADHKKKIRWSHSEVVLVRCGDGAHLRSLYVSHALKCTLHCIEEPARRPLCRRAPRRKAAAAMTHLPKAASV